MTVSRQQLQCVRASTTVRLAYLFPAYWVLLQARDWQQFSITPGPALLWPVRWLEGVDLSTYGPYLFGVSVAGLVLASLVPEQSWARWLGAVALLEHLALRFSLGKIHHLMHGWLLVLWVLCWLPRGWSTPTDLSAQGQRRFLTVFHTCQLLVATTYTLSGIGKLLGIGYQWWQGSPTLLHPLSLARHIAARLIETSDVSLLGPWLIKHGHCLWPATLLMTLLQLAAVWMVRRPRFHRLLGAGLVLFHAMTTLSMSIDFTPAIVLCGALFVVSPFSKPLLGRSLKERPAPALS